MSGTKKYWGDTKYDWPKDKAVIYAVMAICIEEDRAIRIIPNSLRQTECYKVNKHISTWVEVSDLSIEFMDYIEAELENEGLLPSKSDTKTQDKINQPEKDETPDEVIILDDFMEKYCELKGGDIKSKRALIYKHAQNKKIELPQIAGSWKRGQKKLFYTKDLISKWPAYRIVKLCQPYPLSKCRKANPNPHFSLS